MVIRLVGLIYNVELEDIFCCTEYIKRLTRPGISVVVCDQNVFASMGCSTLQEGQWFSLS